MFTAPSAIAFFRFDFFSHIFLFIIKLVRTKNQREQAKLEWGCWDAFAVDSMISWKGWMRCGFFRTSSAFFRLMALLNQPE